MPVNTALAREQYSRYVRARDNGHAKFLESSTKCRDFFFGKQWADVDVAALQKFRRPALTINKIKTTVSTATGEQIANRSEISFRPRGGTRNADVAAALTKVFKQISDNNQLQWLRSDVFLDGLISARGFYDVRLDYDDSMQGEVRIEHLDPHSVVLSPDDFSYDPAKWSEVFVTRWYTPDEIEVLYNKADAELLRVRATSAMEYGFDSIDDATRSASFAGTATRDTSYDGANGDLDSATVRSVRVIDRQHRELRKVRRFLNPTTGDTRRVPDDWDRERIAAARAQDGLDIIERVERAIRWTVTADDIVLHDEWSPYNFLTVVPYFPHFLHGRAAGMVEDILGPQELLNKATSQELHVINSTANSGWKVKAGGLTNMTVEELEQKGSMTGLVLELDDIESAEKIQPNQVPTGLDRVTYKAEEHIKTVSGINDSMQGFDREDVAARAIEKKRQAGVSSTMSKPLDNLTRSDFYLARNILDLVQTFYTEHRIITITGDTPVAEPVSFEVNAPGPEGQIVNDLTLGEYDVVITSVPHRETLEDSEFDQAVALRELGVQIPDDVLIDSSRLQKKKEIIQRMQGDQNTPEAQRAAQRAERLEEAQTAQEEAKAAKTGADAGLSQARTQQVQVDTQLAAEGAGQGDSGVKDHVELATAQHNMDLEERKFEHERQMDFAQLGEDRRKNDQDMQIRAAELQQARQDRADQQRLRAAQAAQKPQGKAKP